MLHELLAQIYAHIRGMWRYRWLAIAVAWLIAAGGWAFIATIPDIYQSSVRVQVDTDSMLEPLLQGLAIQSDRRTRVDMMTRSLLTRPKLEKVARQTGLDLQADTPAKMNALIARLQKGTTVIASSQDQNVYTISHIGTGANTTWEVVQAFLDIFVEEMQGDELAETNTAQKFLEEQVAEYEARLVKAEQELVQFKKENVGKMPGEGGDFYVRLQTALSQLDSLRTALGIASSRRDGLERQLLGEEPVFGIMASQRRQVGSNELIKALDVKIEANRTRREELGLRFTEKHPEIIAVMETIAQLESRREVELSKLQEQSVGVNSVGAELQKNPVYQSMKIAFNEAEIEAGSLEVQVASKQKEIRELKRMVDIIPQVEANLGRLNRDYDITKQQYDVLLQRLETARLSQQAEQSGESIEFQVLDPPSLPMRPSGPNRKVLNSLVMVGGLFAGIGLTFLLHQLHPVFGDTRTLESIVGIPVLGAVSLKRSGVQKIQSNLGLLVVFSAVLLLILTTGGVILYEETVRGMLQIAMRFG